MVFVVMQAMILGRIHLFNIATPLLYIYFVAMIPRNYPKWATLLWSFALGLAVDTFANTPGVAAASMTLAGLIQPYLLELFVPRDSASDLCPSMRTMGVAKFTYYIVILTVVYCLVFFLLDAFSFAWIVEWALCVVSSSALTLLLIITIESFRLRRA